jgi:L-alanine-DL-glutamate epimerase-like enolase superfamily enzyme
MKITKIECIPVTLKLKKPVLMSGGALTGSIAVLLKLHTDEGLIGIADSGGTSEWYSGETQESIMALIKNYYAPKALLGEDPFNIEKIMAKLDKIAKNNNQSKAVVDYALHDLMGKKLGVPVYKLLGGKTIEKIRMGYVISTGTQAETRAEAIRVHKAGFKVVKIKVGFHPDEEDIENVRVIHEAVGATADIMIDANGGWNYFQALRNLKAMEKFNVTLAEQPVPWWDIDGMAKLRHKVNIPIFADESATELSQLMEIIKKEAADGLFIKVAKAGGLMKAQRWVTLARTANLPVMCGCMVGSGFEAAAQAHFLVANEWMSKLEQENIGPLHLYDLTDTVSVKIKNDLAKELPRYENGFMWAPEGPGLGMELNEEVVESLISPGLKTIVIK